MRNHEMDLLPVLRQQLDLLRPIVNASSPMEKKRELLTLANKYQLALAQKYVEILKTPPGDFASQLNYLCAESDFFEKNLNLKGLVNEHDWGYPDFYTQQITFAALHIKNWMFTLSKVERAGGHSSSLRLKQSLFSSPLLILPQLFNKKLNSYQILTPADTNSETNYEGFLFLCAINELFKSPTLVSRIYMAMIFDNTAALELFLTEYDNSNENADVLDFIAMESFVGFAAANGSIKCLEVFIKMKVNLEQKFTMENISEDFAVTNSIFVKYKNVSLEMSPLALAIGIAPVLTREKAKKLIQTLVDAHANFNTKVNSRWTEEKGYYNDRRTIPASKQISLFEFDQTGILDEIVKELKAKKHQVPKAKDKGRHRETHLQAAESSAPLESQVVSLREEVQELKEENKKLWKAIRSLQAQIGHEKTGKETFTKDPKFFAGPGRGQSNN